MSEQDPTTRGEAEPHSAAVLSDWRDDWWNQDFLGMIADRLDLRQVVHAVDVGCGKGHWSRTVRRFLHPSAALVGVDREAEWVHEASTLSEGLERMRFVQGTAEALPLPDASADLVTCQTVLMHVADPVSALVESRIELTTQAMNAAVADLVAEALRVRDEARLEAMAFEI